MSSAPSPLSSSPASMMTTDYLSQGSPPPPSADFLYFTSIPTSYPSPSQMPRATPLSSSPTTSLSERTIEIEPMGAIGIFALNYFSDDNSLIGIKEKGDLELLSGATSLDYYIITPYYRSINHQNGDQLTYLEDPIKDGCAIYPPGNPHIGNIYLWSSFGAVKHIMQYIIKGKPLIVKTLLRISNLFFEQVKKCHSASPYPQPSIEQIRLLSFYVKNLTPAKIDEKLEAQIRVLNGQIGRLNESIFPSAYSSSSQGSPCLRPSLSTASGRPVWTLGDLQKFSEELNTIYTLKSMRHPVIDRLTALVEVTLNTKSATYRLLSSPGGSY